jgi:hypothetical protein
MVQIKAAASLLIAAAAVAPALAQSYYSADDSLVTREDLEELADILARDYGYDIEARDFDDVNELDARELYDELFERDPMFGINHAKKLWHHLTGKGKGRQEHEGFHHRQGHFGEHHEHHGEFRHQQGGFPAGGSPDAPAAAPAPPPSESYPTQYGRSDDDMDELYARELYDDELFERDPMFGVDHAKKLWHHLTGKGKGKAHHEHEHHEHEHKEHEGGFHHEQQGRLGEHRGEFGHYQGGFAAGGSPDASAPAAAPPTSNPYPTQYGRSYDDMEEFEARDVQPEYEELLTRYFNDLYERELAAEDEYTALAARSIEGDDFAELAERSPEPNVFDWFRNLFHPHHKKDDKKKDDKKKDDKDSSKNKSTTTASTSTSTKSSDKSADKDDDSLDSREFDDFWYDLD